MSLKPIFKREEEEIFYSGQDIFQELYDEEQIYNQAFIIDQNSFSIPHQHAFELKQNTKQVIEHQEPQNEDYKAEQKSFEIDWKNAGFSKIMIKMESIKNQLSMKMKTIDKCVKIMKKNIGMRHRRRKNQISLQIVCPLCLMIYGSCQSLKQHSESKHNISRCCIKKLKKVISFFYQIPTSQIQLLKQRGWKVQPKSGKQTQISYNLKNDT